MQPDELQAIKDEMANLGLKVENLNGWLSNFDTTLNNHMTDYKRQQEETNKGVKDISNRFTWGFWILFTLMCVAFTGWIAFSVMAWQFLISG